jgi:hypothetical protein
VTKAFYALTALLHPIGVAERSKQRAFAGIAPSLGPAASAVLCGVLALLALAVIPSAASAADAHLFSTSFGAVSSTPSNPYPLVDPTDVAVDQSTGDFYVANASLDEHQTVTISGATGGTFTLTFKGDTTSAIPYNAGREPVQSAFEKLPSIGFYNSYMTGGELQPYEIVFFNALGATDVPQLTCDASGLTGPAPTCAVATTVNGAPGDDVEKFNSSGHLAWIVGREVDKAKTEEAREPGNPHHITEAEENLCTIVSGDTCQPGTSIATPGGFQFPEYVAVDNSPGGEGNLYVADDGPEGLVSKFTPQGSLIESWGEAGQLNGTSAPGGNFFGGGIGGIAVGSTGTLYVGLGGETLEFAQANGSFRELNGAGARGGGFAVDSAGDVYHSTEGKEGRVLETSPSGELLDEELALPDFVSGLALDPVGEDLYVDRGSEIVRYGAPGEALEPSIGFGGALTAAQGIALGPNHLLYAADPGASRVDVFAEQEVEPPTAAIAAPSEVGYTTAHVSGEVNPKGHPAHCYFEYVSEAHFQAEEFAEKHFTTRQARREAEEAGYEPVGHTPCGVADLGAGSSPVAVEADLSSLIASTVYHVRLVAVGPLVAESEPNPTLETQAVAEPTVAIEAPSAVTSTTAHFSGHIDPNAPEPEPVSALVEAAFHVVWRFHCSPACPGAEAEHELKAGQASEEVSVDASSLLPGIPYEVSLIAKNAGPTPGVGGPVSFIPPAVAPRIDSTSVSVVAETTAALHAQIDPGGASTTAHFEYITAKRYEEDGNSFGAGTIETLESDAIGHDDADHETSVEIEALQPDTTYLYRVVATNEKSPPNGTPGSVKLLHTISTLVFSGCANEALRVETESGSLPDCRAYELVSPAVTVGEVYVPYSPDSPAADLSGGKKPSRAAAVGDAVSYIADPGSSGGNGAAGNGLGNVYLARRTTAGWESANINPPFSAGETATDSAQTHYEAFSPDLALGIIASPSPALASGAEPQGPSNCWVLYSHSAVDGLNHALFSETQTPGCGDSGASGGEGLYFVGESDSHTELFFQIPGALTAGAVSAGSEGANLYDSYGGALSLVDVLPSKAQAPHATFGGPPETEGSSVNFPDFDHAVSADGSRAYWTNLATGKVYLRENPAQPENCAVVADACTVQVSSGAAVYWTATPDGRYAYYTEAGQLWRFDAEAPVGHQREALAGPGSEVQSVIGASEDGSYLYFVAAGALSAEPNDQGEAPTARKCEPASGGTPGEPGYKEEHGILPSGYGCNLYLWHAGQPPRFIAALAARDDKLPTGGDNSEFDDSGDWKRPLGLRTAEPTPDGRQLVFESTQQLTGYENGVLSHATEDGTNEVFRYDVDTARLSCVSCAPTGAAPILPGERGSTYLTISPSLTFRPRWISADGSRVFFNTSQPLSPSDINGSGDVYEWEAEGSESCPVQSPSRPEEGCVFLLSGGSEGSGFSYFLDADESGDNVFFIHHGPLGRVGPAGEQTHLYDVRVDGGFPVPDKALLGEVCSSAEACKPPPAEPPVEPFPASAAFFGAGNLLSVIPPPPPPVKKTAAQLRAEKLTKALRTCRKDKKRAKRVSCEKSARKKDGSAQKTKKAGSHKEGR